MQHDKTTFNRHYLCPCGKHTVHTVTDSAGNTQHQILCPICRLTFTVVHIPANRITQGQGLTQKLVRLVPLKDHLQHQKWVQKQQDLQRKVLKRSHQRHLPIFLNVVLSQVQPVDRWMLLGTLAGPPTRSLKAFLTYGSQAQERMIKNHFQLDRLPRILAGLGIEDPELNRMLAELTELSRKIQIRELRFLEKGHCLQSVPAPKPLATLRVR
ncbi:hypothetical protein [Deinococcus cellulosilyticus]|nr:hypothetical protein [Deinococcus cellulosilyticus]